MAIKIVCDICGKDAQRHQFVYGTSWKAAVASTAEEVHVSAYYDLCTACIYEVTAKVLEDSVQNRYSRNTKLVDEIKTRIKH